MHNLVPMMDFKAQWHETSPELRQALDTVGESGYLILGKEVKAFEAALAEYCSVSASVGCANGLDAIEISLRALGLQPGDKVLTTPLSAFATTLAIIRAGGVPVFVDVDSRGLVDLGLAEAALAADSAIKFFVPVHLYGHSLDLERLRALKKKFQLKIVEDCAQAIGASWRGVPVGTVGQLAALSFYPTKNLGCMGDGGAVLGSDTALISQAAALRDYGQTAKYVHDIIGMNSRLDELQAAILRRAFLPRLKSVTARRRQIAQVYLENIKNSRISLSSLASDCESVWHLFPLLVQGSPEALAAHLSNLNIASGRHYPGLITEQKALQGLHHECVGQLERATIFARTELSIPLHPYMDDSQVARVVDAVNSWKP